MKTSATSDSALEVMAVGTMQPLSQRTAADRLVYTLMDRDARGNGVLPYWPARSFWRVESANRALVELRYEAGGQNYWILKEPIEARSNRHFFDEPAVNYIRR